MATDKVCKVELIPSLRINGNDFTTPASNQEDPIQTLHEDFEELHVWWHSQDEEHISTFWTWHIKIYVKGH